LKQTKRKQTAERFAASANADQTTPRPGEALL
jgi:hypothetical protein